MSAPKEILKAASEVGAYLQALTRSTPVPPELPNTLDILGLTQRMAQYYEPKAKRKREPKAKRKRKS